MMTTAAPTTPPKCLALPLRDGFRRDRAARVDGLRRRDGVVILLLAMVGTVIQFRLTRSRTNVY